MGLQDGRYFYLEPELVRVSDKNYLRTRVVLPHLSHKLQVPDIKNYQDLKPELLEE